MSWPLGMPFVQASVTEALVLFTTRHSTPSSASCGGGRVMVIPEALATKRPLSATSCVVSTVSEEMITPSNLDGRSRLIDITFLIRSEHCGSLPMVVS